MPRAFQSHAPWPSEKRRPSHLERQKSGKTQRDTCPEWRPRLGSNLLWPCHLELIKYYLTSEIFAFPLTLKRLTFAPPAGESASPGRVGACLSSFAAKGPLTHPPRDGSPLPRGERAVSWSAANPLFALSPGGRGGPGEGGAACSVLPLFARRGPLAPPHSPSRSGPLDSFSSSYWMNQPII